MNSFLEFEYLEGEEGSDLVLRLWVGQSLAWFHTIRLTHSHLPESLSLFVKENKTITNPGILGGIKIKDLFWEISS